MYVWNSIVLFIAVFLFPLFFLNGTKVLNVSIFVAPCYIDKKFIVLWYRSLKSQTDLSNITYVVGDYITLALFFLYPQKLKFRGALHHQDKFILGGIYWSWFLVCIFEPVFFLNIWGIEKLGTKICVFIHVTNKC